VGADVDLQGALEARWDALDQAFGAVEYPEDAVAFQPVETDALSRVVQAEMTRQMHLLMTAESALHLRSAVGDLRTSGQS
jgi:hypothetical protein